MKRRLFNLLATGSLLLFVVGSILLVRSTNQRDSLAYLNADGSGLFVSTGPDEICFGAITRLSVQDFPGWKKGLSHDSARWGAARALLTFDVAPRPLSVPIFDTPEPLWNHSFTPEGDRIGFVGSSIPGLPAFPNTARRTSVIVPVTGSSNLSAFFGFGTTNDWRPPAHGRFGFGWDMKMPEGSTPFAVSDCYAKRLVVPIWFALILFAMLPLQAVLSIVQRRRRIANGRCADCGYDLRVTPDACPECGARARRAVAKTKR